jgi:hypothetical protein
MALRLLLLAALFPFLPLRAAEAKPLAPEPRLLSIYPLTGTAGQTHSAVIRATGIQTAQSIHFSGRGLTGIIRHVRPEPAEPEPSGGKGGTVLIDIDLTVAQDSEPGDHSIRLVTPAGLTNQLNMRVGNSPVVVENGVAAPLRRYPVTLNGRIAQRGESDSYWIDVQSGQTLTFEAVAGNPAFDPAISIHESSGSWFNPKRLNRVAFNDEPLHFPGLSPNPRLVYTFSRAGAFCVKIGAFSGQGGPDHVYELRITPGTTPVPALHPKPNPTWAERDFTRSLSTDWLQRVAGRSGAPLEITAPELYSAVSVDAGTIPVMSVPGIIQGRLTKPAEVHTIRLRIDKAQDIAFEIETPEATMPRFNPVVRLLEPGGAEIVTNVQTKLNNNGLYMMKMIQAKTTVSLRNPGEFVIQIRDITTDCAGDDFVYRVLVRPQIPHLGRINIADDVLNIHAGKTKPLTITIEREEDFGAPLTFSIEGLPQGLSAVPGISEIEEKPLLFNGGKMERYTPKTQKAVLLVAADGSAPPTTEPVVIRVLARPFVNGTLGDPIPVKDIALFVLPRSSS